MSEEIERLFARYATSGVTEVDHTLWDTLLARFIVPSLDGVNRVDYARVKAEGLESLNRYVASLEAVDVTALGRAQQFAFWINLYNAAVVRLVANHYPMRSILEISPIGPWKDKLVIVNQIALSLDDIENVILRGLFGDPRLHYAINCGSVGCPSLQLKAFTGAALDAQLDRAARDFINNPRAVRYEDGKLVLSGIFKWYRRDFEGDERGVLAHISRYTDKPARHLLDGGKFDDYSYDWGLNDVPRH